jgi:hypothetical protein
VTKLAPVKPVLDRNCVARVTTEIARIATKSCSVKSSQRWTMARRYAGLWDVLRSRLFASIPCLTQPKARTVATSLMVSRKCVLVLRSV